MLLQDTLDKMAESTIPEGQHKYLHVNSRETWVKLVMKILKKKKTKLTTSEMKRLLFRWEEILFQHFSLLN